MSSGFYLPRLWEALSWDALSSLTNLTLRPYAYQVMFWKRFFPFCLLLSHPEENRRQTHGKYLR